MKLFIKTLSGKTLFVEPKTICDLRTIIDSHEGIPPQHLLLTCQGKIVNESENTTLEDESTIHISLKLVGG